MVKIKWSDFLNPDKKIAINCQTEEEAREFLGKLDKMGVKWCDGTPLPSNSSYAPFQQSTCYAISTSGFSFGIGYADIEFYNDEGFDIYGYSIVEFVDDDPEKLIKNPETPTTAKSMALDNIVKAMTEVRCNLEDDCDFCEVLTSSAAMKMLAEAFEIVSRTEV